MEGCDDNKETSHDNVDCDSNAPEWRILFSDFVNEKKGVKLSLDE